MDEQGEAGGRRFVRPWEDDTSGSSGGVEPEDALFGEDAEDPFDHIDYFSATTSEYRRLAEEVSRTSREETRRQAVAAAIPGVNTGLVGFEDVTGEKGISEEEVELEEQRRASDLTLRIGTAVVLIGLFLASLALNGAWFTGFVTLVMLISLGEFYATLRSAGWAPVALFGLIGVVAMGVAVHRSGLGSVPGWLAAVAVAVALFYSVVRRRRPLENASLTVFGLAWISLLAPAIALGRSERAIGLVLLLVAVTAGFDVGAYFVGRGFGRRPLAPQISPKKTIEGLIGGVVSAVLVAAVLSTFPLFDPLDLTRALGFAALVSVAAPLGDAAESVVKRALGVKDMGSILPGHGGMLDRIDAFLFVVPSAYLFFSLVGYV